MSARVADLAPGRPPITVNNIMGSGTTNLFLWFVIIFIILILLAWLLAPMFLLKKSAEGVPIAKSLDWGKVILYSIILDLIIVLLIYLFSGKK